jgi:long-chain acyl-CoA synthetase
MLLEKIAQNKNLIFKDINAQKEKTFQNFNLEGFAFDSYSKSLVVLYLDNSLDSIEVFFGFYNSKHAIAMLSRDLSPSLKEQIEENYQPQFIFDDNREEISGYQKQNEIFVKECPSTFIIAPEIKILLSTSGTTGSPKFVKLSDDNIFQNASSIINYLPINNEDVCPLNLPIYYSYGLSILTTNAISGGTIICGVKDILNKDFWVDFETFGFTSLAGVPYVYEILNRIGFLKKQYSSLRYLTQAGGKLNEKLVVSLYEYTQNQAVDFFVMYGQTEATARMSFFNTKQFPDKIGSVGKAILNGSFEIDVENSELLYKGPNVFGGYAEKVDDLAIFHKEEVLHTGDLATMDQDKFVFITGRLKRFVKILGSRINLDEVEQALKNHFPNTTFICVGKEDQYLQIASTNLTLGKNEIGTYIKDLFKIHPAYIKYKLIENVPLTSNGKINYNAILD